jgi:hypothetical protein
MDKGGCYFVKDRWCMSWCVFEERGLRKAAWVSVYFTMPSLLISCISLECFCILRLRLPWLHWEPGPLGSSQRLCHCLQWVSISIGSTNCRLEYLGEKNSRKAQKAKLEFTVHWHCWIHVSGGMWVYHAMAPTLSFKHLFQHCLPRVSFVDFVVRPTVVTLYSFLSLFPKQHIITTFYTAFTLC